MSDEAISEQELINNLEGKAVQRLRLVQDEDLRFRIYATLSWKENEQLLETQRKKPRAWASLDRLVEHIKNKYRPMPVIELHLRSDDEYRISNQKHLTEPHTEK